MEFGVYLRKEHTYDRMLDLALHAEELEYFGGFINDHVIGFGDEGREPYLEAWTAMTGIGVETTKFRVGQIVLFNSLRNPAYLAKSIATLDNMTNGRYELLIGAGWNEREYKGYDLIEKGQGMPSAGERVDRFKETLEILNSMLHNEITDYDGKYWKLKEAINVPQPVQHPFRISTGCKGPRMMRITAKYANGINLSGSYLPDVYDLIDQFNTIVKENTENKLRDYFVSGFGGIEITENQNKLNDIVKDRAKNKEITKDQALNNYLIGNAEDIVSKFRKLQDKGMDMFVTAITVDDELSTDKLAYFKDNVMNEI